MCGDRPDLIRWLEWQMRDLRARSPITFAFMLMNLCILAAGLMGLALVSLLVLLF